MSAQPQQEINIVCNRRVLRHTFEDDRLIMQREGTWSTSLESVEHLNEVNLGHLFKPGEYHMTMGLRKFDERNWLTMSDNCHPEHRLRAELLTESKSKVLQCPPESESACLEALEVVLDFLTKTWPDVFERFGANNKFVNNKFVRNNKTGEEFHLDAEPPLEVAARLVIEDLNVLKESDEGYVLAASATCFPVVWSLEEKIGWPITRLHESVPGWEEKIGNYTTPILFHPHPFPISATTSLSACDLVIRHERQTFRRLPKSNAILFTVRTYMDRLVDLSKEDSANFAAAVRAWPDNVASYKGRDFWGPAALNYYDEKTKER
ncbi:hypothetical protein FGG08_006037 [Glutinoglossum americanum]|uniref:DUF3445 domain-containing protein n=1 Tax=Glutinoglossum americanum TaxID=1670608 RepID=A0A9P8HTD9_9PEZI|nr:hypothetical protein FGG08_006037 [Glutinoglossum americanum]